METKQDKIPPVLMDIPMPIVTPRLIIRPAMPGDGAEAAKAIEETWDQLHRWMPWAVEPDNADQAEIRVREAYAKFIIREDMRMHGFERETGRMVVFTGLHRFDWDMRAFEVGYWVRAEAQGQGYATEATNALIRYAFGALGAKRIIISHAGGNEPSRAVIRKLGFVHEGTFSKAHRLPDGRIDDDVRYARFDAAGLPPLQVEWGKAPVEKNGTILQNP